MKWLAIVLTICSLLLVACGGRPYTPPVVVIPGANDSMPNAVVGYPYHYQCKAEEGIPPYRWSIVEGELPDGLSIDPDTGLISGIATGVAYNSHEGVWKFRIQVTDSQ